MMFPHPKKIMKLENTFLPPLTLRDEKPHGLAGASAAWLSVMLPHLTEPHSATRQKKPMAGPSCQSRQLMLPICYAVNIPGSPTAVSLTRSRLDCQHFLLCGFSEGGTHAGARTHILH